MGVLKVQREREGITLISLNRPEKRNALNVEMMTQLCNAVEEAGRDPSQRILILLGEGSVFCGGLDLQEAQDTKKIDESSYSVSKMLTAVHRSTCITIAVVQGGAFAGGAGLLAACDFVIAEERALFGFPETRRGLIAAQVMPLLLRQMSYRDLKELLLFGEIVDAQRASQMGLVNIVSPKEKLMGYAFHYAEQALKGAPTATIKTKKLMNELYPDSFSENLAHALSYHYQARKSSEAQEGITAFFDNREPEWVKNQLFDRG